MKYYITSNHLLQINSLPLLLLAWSLFLLVELLILIKSGGVLAGCSLQCFNLTRFCIKHHKRAFFFQFLILNNKKYNHLLQQQSYFMHSINSSSFFIIVKFLFTWRRRLGIYNDMSIRSQILNKFSIVYQMIPESWFALFNVKVFWLFR